MSQYASFQDLQELGLPPGALEELSYDEISAHLTAESGLVDSYLAARYTLPLADPVPDAIRLAVVYLAVCSILLRRGYNPETYDTQYADRCRDTMAWLKAVATGSMTVPGVELSPTRSDRARVATRALRGWQDGT